MPKRNDKTGAEAMILRKWSGRIRTSQADEYIRYIGETGASHYTETAGNLGFQILLRDIGDGTSEISTISWWKDLDAVRRFAGDDYDVARYYSEDEQYLLDRPSFVEHHIVYRSDLTPFIDTVPVPTR
jgi:heme-degrading monooxygenase HmoA